jgi:hypothetical protein
MGMMNKHRSFCLDKECYCKTFKIILGNDNTNFLISKKFISQYILQLVKEDIAATLFYTDVDYNFLKFVQYMDYLMELGKNSFAIQNIIEFINENDKMKRVKNN